MERFDWMFGTQMPNALAVFSAFAVAVYAFLRRKQLERVVGWGAVTLAVLMCAVVAGKNIAHTLLIDWSNVTGAAKIVAYDDFATSLRFVALAQAVISVAFVLLSLRVANQGLHVRKRPAQPSGVVREMLLFAGLAAAYAVFCSSEWSRAYDSGLQNGYQVTSPWLHWGAWLVLVSVAVVTVRRALRLRAAR